MIFPFIAIYLLLFLLNWNEKKNLLSDSWFAFIAWLVSSFTALFVGSAFKIASFSDFISSAFFLLFILVVNICAITAVLYLKTKAKIEDLSITDNLSDESIGRVGILKILQTSVIVSFMTLIMVTSLGFALQDISQKMEKNKLKKEGENGVSFEIYH